MSDNPGTGFDDSDVLIILLHDAKSATSATRTISSYSGVEFSHMSIELGKK